MQFLSQLGRQKFAALLKFYSTGSTVSNSQVIPFLCHPGRRPGIHGAALPIAKHSRCSGQDDDQITLSSRVTVLLSTVPLLTTKVIT